MINRIRIENLKNGSPEYDKAIDDVLALFDLMKKSCRIIHTKTGLYYNGYEKDSDRYKTSKGKNTLSPSSWSQFMVLGRDDKKILEASFKKYLKEENGVKFMKNHIVYAGSVIHDHLKKHYLNYEYLPLEDFHVEIL